MCVCEFIWMYCLVFMCVSEGLYQEKVEIRTGEEWDALFQGLLGSLGPQIYNSALNFPEDQEGQIWARYNYGWGLGSERSHWWCPTGIVKYQKKFLRDLSAEGRGRGCLEFGTPLGCVTCSLGTGKSPPRTWTVGRGKEKDEGISDLSGRVLQLSSPSPWTKGPL